MLITGAPLLASSNRSAIVVVGKPSRQQVLSRAANGLRFRKGWDLAVQASVQAATLVAQDALKGEGYPADNTSGRPKAGAALEEDPCIATTPNSCAIAESLRG